MAKPETLSDTIAAIIKARGITSYALAKASGVNASVIQRFINGERGLRLETAEKLVQSLDLVLTEKKPKKK